MLVLLVWDWVGPVKNFQSPVWGSSSTSGGLNPLNPLQIECWARHRGRWGIWTGVPLPNQLRGLGSVVSSPSGVRGRAPAANAFLAYLKPTEQPLKAQFFVKDHSDDRLGGMATGQSLPEQGGGRHSGLAPPGYSHGSAWLKLY